MADTCDSGGRGPTNTQDQDSSLTSVTRVTPDHGERTHTEWTPALVEERLRKAVALRSALIADRIVDAIVAGRDPEGIGTVGGIRSSSPTDVDDQLGVHAAEALSWLRWLGPDDAALVRARLSGAPWKSICWRFGISRPTADRRWRYALALIAWRLNGHGGSEQTPSLRSLLGIGMRRAA